MSTESRELLDNWARHYSISPSAMEALHSVLSTREALAHSRAQDSGGEAYAPESVRHVAWHIGKAVEYIEKVWPDAKMLDRDPILRNMRRWHKQLTTAAEQPAKGEKWRCACGDLNYPNETCAMCNQSAPQPSDPADAEKWGQQYRCGCFLGFPTKRAIPASCPQHMRDKQGGALPLDATPPTAQRHDARDRVWDAILGELNLAYARGVDGSISDSISAADRIRSILAAAHGAGAAVEAVELLRQVRQQDYLNDSIRGKIDFLLSRQPQQCSEQVAGGGGVDAAWALVRRWKSRVIDGEELSLEEHMRLMGCAAMLEAALSTQPLLSDQPGGVSNGVGLIAAERRRHVESEGWTPEHDDAHDAGEMALAAGCYSIASYLDSDWSLERVFKTYWPWDEEWWKPRGGIADLVRAGALIAAEIDRLQRAALHPEQAKDGAAG